MLHTVTTQLMRPTEPVLNRTEVVTAVCTAVGAVEEISRLRDNYPDTLHSWEIRRTASTILSARVLNPVTWWFQGRRELALPITKALCAAVILTSTHSDVRRSVAVATTAALLWAKSLRAVHGSDGSDQVAFLSTAVAALARLPLVTERDRQLLVWFLGFQSVLSYFVAGVAKVISPAWRDGSALTGILRTRTYGERRLYNFFHARPRLNTFASRSVAVLETIAPLVLVMPGRYRRLGIAALGGFHLANARVMGLNRFFWAFAGTHSALDHLGGSVRSIMGAMTR